MVENEPSWRELYTPERFAVLIGEIASKREEKGSSEILIPQIRNLRGVAETFEEITSVVQLYQEEFLCGQHMVMEERSKGLKKANWMRLAKGMWTMASTTNDMEKYLGEEEGINPLVRARIFRFLGRYSDYMGHYKKSAEYYRRGIAEIDLNVEPEEKFNRLEFIGFLSYSLLKQGRLTDGVSMAEATLKKFDETPEGKLLKENNYYTWAVWKSGIEIRTAEHILDTERDLYWGKNAELIEDAERILHMPDGTTEAFRLRLDELNSVKAKMNRTKI
jgi:hypothetical protein